MAKWWSGALAVFLIALVAGRSASAEPAASNWVTSEQGKVRLISAVSATGESGNIQLGLEFELNPDWKIYWRSPGDAGYPPSIDWKGSDNLADTVMSWPAPHRFSISGLETMGYKGRVILPIAARVNDPSQPLILRAAVDFLTCAVVCVPQHADLSLSLASGPSVATPHAYEISRFIAAVPSDGARAGLSLVSAEASDSGDLVVTVKADPALKDPDLFLERADQMQFTVPKVEKSQGGRQVVFRVRPLENTGEGGLTDKPVTLTVVDGDRGMEAVTNLAPPQPGIRFPRLLGMLGVALLGGLILNLMPCVLPVLSLKILALIGHGGGDKKDIRSGFLATAAGIVISFLALAAMTSIIKLAGTAVGWGVQFQQPLFLGIMIALVTLFAANLFGWFEIPLPQFLSDIGANAGSQSSGWVGHFATGAFATLLATPCSAPFLGTAVGFALAHGTLEIFSIFLLLGLGMAMPYLAVAAWPQLAQKLPRPGGWMITARKVLGLALLATGIWLLSVLAIVVGLQIGLAVAAAMALALLLLALAHRIPAVPKGLVMVGTIVVAVGLSMMGEGPSAEDRKAISKGLWKPFDQQVVAAEVAAGHTVFVDVTAEWCLTCQVNKATVVYRGDVAKRLKAPGIVAMQADWTRPDETIANYLASFGRYGIPFDAVYGPGAPQGLVLPELLTDDAVLQALDQAAGKPAS